MPRYASDIFRAVPGGAAVGIQVDLVDMFKHDGDTSVEADIDTNADGLWAFTYVPEGSAATQWILDPGPLFWTGTYASQTRKGSTLASPLLGPNSAHEIHYALSALGDGVILGALTGDFAVSWDGAGLDVDVAAGKYLLDGIQITNPSTRKINAGTAHATLPRIDRVVLEMTRTVGDQFGKTVLKVVAGTANASPVAPTLTDNATTLQKSLAQIRVNAASANITSVTDERSYTVTAVSRNPMVTAFARASAGASALSTTEASLASLALSPTLLSGIYYDIIEFAEVYADGTSSVAMISPFIGGTTELAAYQSAPAQTGIVTLTNAHSREGVLGTGVSISCGVLAKRSGTANTVNWYGGTSRVMAIPRL